MRYKVKKDKWIISTLYGILIFMIIIPIVVADLVEPDERFAVIIVALISASFILPITWGSVYILEGDRLHIRLGYIIKNVKYENIIEIKDQKKLTNNSFALSSDIVDVITDKGLIRHVIISPMDKQNFMIDLKSRCPNLKGRYKIEEDYDF